MSWGEIQLKTDTDGVEYLEFREKLTKTRQESGSRSFAPKIFGREGARCPVELYKKYRSHRPEMMLDNESPFYLGIKGGTFL